MSKNNKKRGIYHYATIIEHDGKYFFGSSITTDNPTNIKGVCVNSLQIIREIPKEYYKANNLE